MIRWDSGADPLETDGIEASERNGEAAPELLLELGKHAFHRQHQDALAFAPADEFGK